MAMEAHQGLTIGGMERVKEVWEKDVEGRNGIAEMGMGGVEGITTMMIDMKGQRIRGREARGIKRALIMVVDNTFLWSK